MSVRVSLCIRLCVCLCELDKQRSNTYSLTLWAKFIFNVLKWGEGGCTV